MKITIKLTIPEVRGVKKYLKEVGDIEKVSKSDVQEFVSGITLGSLHAPQEAVSDYITIEEMKSL